MIQEIINYTKHLKENSPKVFEEGLEPSKGLHIFIELDEKGNAINFPGEKGVDWDYYDGKGKSKFIKEIIPYHFASTYVTMNKQKKFDKKQKIHSASPFAVEFNFNFSDNDKKLYGIIAKPSKEERVKNDRLIKTKRVEIVSGRLGDYFDATEKVFEVVNKFHAVQMNFKLFLKEKINKQISQKSKEFIEIKRFWDQLKEKEYCKIYLKNIDLKTYESTYAPYLESSIFNKDKFNIHNDNETFGVLDYYTTFADNKVFLKHKTGYLKNGISYRFTGKDAKLLKDFSNIRKAFPSPLPLFIDKNEFKTGDNILRIFKDDGKLTYTQILKQIFKSNSEIVLQNYYLLFFGKEGIEDFDFVSKFRYSFEENGKYPEIKNLFDIKIKKDELKRNYPIKNIFHFEADIVKILFNGILVGGDIDKKYRVNYFNEIDPYIKDNKGEKLSEPIYQMILKYRKAFYDYIYKSKTQAISCAMWDEIMWNSIIGDLRSDKMTDKGYHSKDYSIKEKLNIWFSLYRYFTNNLNRNDMASKIPELLEKMKKVANDENTHFDTTEEFAFGAGQVVYFLLNQSRAGERTHALLEPFIQKVKAEQLQNSIAQAINMYKHEISFGHGRFERLSAEVLAHETNDNLKDFQRLLLAGYFATPVIYEKKENEN